LTMISALIIEDEKNARIALKSDLAAVCPEVQVVGEVEGVQSALQAIVDLEPELVFMDIQLKDGSGFDILNALDTIDFKLIFTTAYSEFAIRAFQFAAVDYLLKPIDIDRLAQAVKRVTEQEGGNGLEERIRLLLENQMGISRNRRRITLPTHDGLHIIKVEEIVRIESESNYSNVFLEGDKKILVARTLKEFENLLEDSGFCRVHQSHLVNLHQVDRYLNRDNGYLILSDGATVPISVRKKSMVLNLIKGL